MNDSLLFVAGNEVLVLVVGAFVSFLIQKGKKTGANPLHLMAGFSILIATVWGVATQLVPTEVLEKVITLGMDIASRAAIVFAIFKVYWKDRI